MGSKQHFRLAGTLGASLAVLLALSLAACESESDSGSSTDSTSNVSCALSSSGIDTCVDYTGNGYTSVAAIQAGCSLGTYSDSPCSSESRIGTCTWNSGLPTEFRIRYYSPSLDAAAAEAACTDGTFTAG